MSAEVTPIPQPWMLLNREDCEHPLGAFAWYHDSYLYCGDCGLTFVPSVSIHEAIGSTVMRLGDPKT